MFFQHLGGFTARIKMGVYEERGGLCCAFTDLLASALSEDEIRPQSASIMGCAFEPPSSASSGFGLIP